MECRVWHLAQACHHLAQLLLAVGQLAAAREVGAQVGRDAVHDQQLERLLGHLGSQGDQQVCTMRLLLVCWPEGRNWRGQRLARSSVRRVAKSVSAGTDFVENRFLRSTMELIE